MTLRIRYLTLKFRALCWVLRRLRMPSVNATLRAIEGCRRSPGNPLLLVGLIALSIRQIYRVFTARVSKYQPLRCSPPSQIGWKIAYPWPMR